MNTAPSTRFCRFCLHPLLPFQAHSPTRLEQGADPAGLGRCARAKGSVPHESAASPENPAHIQYFALLENTSVVLIRLYRSKRCDASNFGLFLHKVLWESINGASGELVPARPTSSTKVRLVIARLLVRPLSHTHAFVFPCCCLGCGPWGGSRHHGRDLQASGCLSNPRIFWTVRCCLLARVVFFCEGKDLRAGKPFKKTTANRRAPSCPLLSNPAFLVTGLKKLTHSWHYQGPSSNLSELP